MPPSAGFCCCLINELHVTNFVVIAAGPQALPNQCSAYNQCSVYDKPAPCHHGGGCCCCLTNAVHAVHAPAPFCCGTTTCAKHGRGVFGTLTKSSPPQVRWQSADRLCRETKCLILALQQCIPFSGDQCSAVQTPNKAWTPGGTYTLCWPKQTDSGDTKHTCVVELYSSAERTTFPV